MSLAKKIHLQPAEQIILTARPGWAAGIVYYFFGFVFLLASAFFTFWLLAHGWWGQGLWGAGLGLGVVIIIRAWFYGYTNVLVVTNLRAVDVTRHSLFNETISSVGLDDIKDVLAKRKGFLATIFNYGDIIIEIKDKELILEVDKISRPQKISEQIKQAIKNFIIASKLNNAEAVYNAFLKIIPELTEEKLALAEKKIDNRLNNLANNSGESSVTVV